jgi:hypothetical protein
MPYQPSVAYQLLRHQHIRVEDDELTNDEAARSDDEEFVCDECDVSSIIRGSIPLGAVALKKSDHDPLIFKV